MAALFASIDPKFWAPLLVTILVGGYTIWLQREQLKAMRPERHPGEPGTPTPTSFFRRRQLRIETSLFSGPNPTIVT